MLIFQKYQIQFSLFFSIMGLVWIGVSSVFFKPNDENSIVEPHVGFIAPDFTLEALNNEKHRLSDYEGNAVLLNFWASWCTPCKTEMPAMQNTYEQYKDQKLILLAVNVTSQDNIIAVSKFANDLNLTFPVLLDKEGIISTKYQIRAFPTTFFIDKNGEISEVIVGGPLTESAIRSRIQKLLIP